MCGTAGHQNTLAPTASRLSDGLTDCAGRLAFGGTNEQAEGDAEAGEVVISAEARKLIAYNVKGVEIKATGNFRVDAMVERKQFPQRTLVLDDLTQTATDDWDATDNIMRMLRCYVPLPVLMAIESGQSLWVAELRIISTIFCRPVVAVRPRVELSTTAHTRSRIASYLNLSQLSELNNGLSFA